MSCHLPFQKKVAAIGMLAEGSSIRGIERVLRIHRDTVVRLLHRIGEACETLMQTSMHDLTLGHVQVDEIWGFVGKKKRNVTELDNPKEVGDLWTFVALDSDTKLVPCYRVGKRELSEATAFLRDLASRTANRIQITTDGWRGYFEAMDRAFKSQVDYAQIIKVYKHDANRFRQPRRYSPGPVIGIEKMHVKGWPDLDLASTSYIESQNLTMRMHIRRLTRLTNAWSKKVKGFVASVALHFAYYNFVMKHTTINTTPAIAAGVADHIWTIEELVELESHEQERRIPANAG